MSSHHFAAGTADNEAAAHATRVPSGHPEGYLEAFAILYRDAAERILRGLDRGKRVVAFPAHIALLMRIARLLPALQEQAFDEFDGLFFGDGVEVDAGVHARCPSKFAIIDTAASCFTCRPHSLAPSFSHHQRPERKSSPTAMARVQGAQPMLGMNWSCSGL